jgi:hypothetical protein
MGQVKLLATVIQYRGYELEDFFYILLTVHPEAVLDITTNLTHFFQCIYFSTSTCFKRQALIIRREQLYQYILWYNTLAR